MPPVASITNFISAVGFPIFVAVILLLRVDQMHTANIRAINALTQEIALLRQWMERSTK